MPHSMFCEARDSHPQLRTLDPKWLTWCVLVPLWQFMKQKHQQQQHSQHHRQTKHITTNTDRHSGSQHSATCTCFWNSSTTDNGCTAVSNNNHGLAMAQLSHSYSGTRPPATCNISSAVSFAGLIVWELLRHVMCFALHLMGKTCCVSSLFISSISCFCCSSPVVDRWGIN